MASKNDITGDTIKSKVGEHNKYADGWEKIFGNKTQKTEDKNDEGKTESGKESESLP